MADQLSGMLMTLFIFRHAEGPIREILKRPRLSVCLDWGWGVFIKKNHFMFSSRFVLFSTFLEKKKILGGGYK